jgi:hypothetical protein
LGRRRVERRVIEYRRRVADWTFAFRGPAPITIETCRQALAAFAGGEVTVETSEFTGNPRDGYWRSVTITARHPDREMRLVMSLSQESWRDSEDGASTRLDRVELRGASASFGMKLATWHALREAFAALGWVDRTLTTWPAPIVDDAVAAGEGDVAARLRADITAALIAEANKPGLREVRLWSPRADDLEAVLAAYPEPAQIVLMTLADVGIRALPKAFARFPNIEVLTLDGNELGDGALRGVSLPALYMLSLGRCPIRELGREDLAGFPQLAHLDVSGTGVQEVAADVGTVCPKLQRVVGARWLGLRMVGEPDSS